MKIKAIAHIDGKIIQYRGKIEIYNMNHKQIYISWQILANNKLLAAKSENLFVDTDTRGLVIKKEY